MNRLFLLYQLLFLLVSAGIPLSADPIVMEAEHADSISLNYEIHEHEGASNGLVISTTEGAGGDFPYYQTPVKDINIGTARYTVDIPEAGMYFLGVRAFWMDKCGNQVWAKVDSRNAFHISSPDKAPETFKKWYWEAAKKPVSLSKGTHVIELHVGEDGSAIDQVALFKAGEKPDNPGTENWSLKFRDKPVSVFSLSVSKETELISSEGRHSMTFYIRKLVKGPASGKLSIYGPEDMKLPDPGALSFSMKDGEVLTRIHTTLIFPVNTPRGEKKITATVSDENRQVAAAASCIIARPFDWYAVGALPPMTHIEALSMMGKKVDLNKEPFPGKGWKKVPYEAMNPYQTIDFEKMYGDSVSVCAYLYTEITVPETGDYLVLVNNDGAVQVWIDGKQEVADFGHHPAVGWLKQPYIRLEKGTHPVLVRVEQNSRPEDGFQANYWLFRLRFRQRRNLPSDISGVECVKN